MKYLKTYETYSQINICPHCLNIHLNNFNKLNENIKNISSLQINVPLKGCINSCKSCIARIHDTHLKIKNRSINQIIDEDKYIENLEKISKHCKSAVLTSDMGEPAQNMIFIKKFGELNKKLSKPFDIELQTTGVLMGENNLKIFKDINLNVVSLSIFDVVNYKNNTDIIGVKNKLMFDLPSVCKNIKKQGFLLRISINLIKEYDNYSMENILNSIKKLGANQITFKNLWYNHEDNPINNWIKANKASDNFIKKMSSYLNENGKKLDTINIFMIILVYF